MIQLWMTLVLSTMPSNELYERVEHGHADSDGVKIHYASLGEGPLVVMIHGFPDFARPVSPDWTLAEPSATHGYFGSHGSLGSSPPA